MSLRHVVRFGRGKNAELVFLGESINYEEKGLSSEVWLLLALDDAGIVTVTRNFVFLLAEFFGISEIKEIEARLRPIIIPSISDGVIINIFSNPPVRDHRKYVDSTARKLGQFLTSNIDKSGNVTIIRDRRALRLKS